MDGDNLSLQADEVEALAAIYGDDWQVVDEARRTFSITIGEGEKDPHHTLQLQITLPVDYPSSAPPHYLLNAPWLRGPDRVAIQNVLEQLYIENIGESIIYMWVEKLREILTDMELGDKEKADVSEDTGDDTSFDFDASNCSQDYSTHTDSQHSSASEEKTLEEPEIFQGEPMSDRKSTFQAFLAKITHKDQVKIVMDTLLQNKKIASATHNIYAYRVLQKEPREIIVTGCEDDGEIHAGNRMLHLLTIMDAINVIVIVSRWYGGIHLGPDRFKHINNCTRILLEEHGFTRPEDKKHDKKK